MKTMKKLFYFLFFVATVFLSSCDSENKPISVSPVSEILKMHPVVITVASWIEHEKHVDLKIETEQEFREAVENPKNWIVFFETADVNQINTIMAALAKPSDEAKEGGLELGDKIFFKNKSGHIKWAILWLFPEENKVILGDRIYDEETYNIFANILNIKPIKPNSEPNTKR
jgi:hypothetical protein